MDVTKTLTPGVDGTKRFLSQYGDKLICVRHRQDSQNQRRITTVELIVEERSLPSPGYNAKYAIPATTLVHVNTNYHETDLRKKAKLAGAKWLPQQKQWVMPYHIARKLHLEERVNDMNIPF